MLQPSSLPSPLRQLARAGMVCACCVVGGTQFVKPAASAPVERADVATRMPSPMSATAPRTKTASARYRSNDPRRYFTGLRGGGYYAPGVDPKNMVTFRFNLWDIPGRPHHAWASPKMLEDIRRRLQTALHEAGTSKRAARMTHVKVLNNFYEREDSTGFGYMSWAIVAVWGPHRICGYFRVDPTMWSGDNDADDATCGTLREARDMRLWGITGETPGAHQASWTLLPDTVVSARDIYNKPLFGIDGGKKAVDVPIINNVATAMNGTPRRGQVVKYLRVRSRDGTTTNIRLKQHG